jgi:hypothetical protein
MTLNQALKQAGYQTKHAVDHETGCDWMATKSGFPTLVIYKEEMVAKQEGFDEEYQFNMYSVVDIDELIKELRATA